MFSAIHFLNSSNPMLSKVYGLPKIYKPGPLRIIISFIGNPLHNLATYLDKILVSRNI